VYQRDALRPYPTRAQEVRAISPGGE